MSAARSKPDLDVLRERFLAAQLRCDRRAAVSIVLEEGLGCGVSVTELHEHVLQAAQREIGRLWQENLVTVAQEHMATAISNLVLTQLFERATTAPRNGKRVLVSCVEGEQHEFPARLVADALELAGFGVLYLGANVPTDSLLQMLLGERPDIVALSATMSFHAPALRDAVLRIREQQPDLLVAVGGGVLSWSPGLASELAVDITGGSASELVAAASRRLGIAP